MFIFFYCSAIYELCETARAIGYSVSTRTGHDEQEHFNRKLLVIICYLSHEEDAVAMKCAETPIVCSIQKPNKQGRAERSAYSPQEHTH
jgi:hypothetical protein